MTALNTALERLHIANQKGWGAYLGLATRRPGLSRWQRGALNTLIEIPALVVDIDLPSELALPAVNEFPIPSSCIVRSGHGLHVYWRLEQPATDMQSVTNIMHGLANALDGDKLSAATALRLPGSMNTKHDDTIPCEVLETHWERTYSLSDFAHYENGQQHRTRLNKALVARSLPRRMDDSTALNPRLIETVAEVLLSNGFRPRGTWLNGSCFHAYHHKHADSHSSFGFNTATGYGYCFVCGSMLLKDICTQLQINPDSVGGLRR